jgi:uncharacterized phiE125 gp8 family phage protein
MAFGALSTKVSATADPVTLYEARAQVREVATTQDVLLSSLITAATQDAERLMQRPIMPQQWQWVADKFSAESDSRITIPVPSRSVVSFNYVRDTDGTTVALALNTDYLADFRGEYYTLFSPAYGTAWPTPRSQPGAVEVVLNVGWVDADSVPMAIKQWILMRVGALFAHREAWTSGEAIFNNPFIDRMLDRWCINGV